MLGSMFFCLILTSTVKENIDRFRDFIISAAILFQKACVVFNGKPALPSASDVNIDQRVPQYTERG